MRRGAERACRSHRRDSIRVGHLSVRLERIDAPELRQDCEMPDGTSYACGAEAAAFLTTLINGATVSCDTAGQDRYGRILGICHVRDLNLNAEMVRFGRALAFRKYSDLYVAQEAQAEAERVGIWAGSFDYPWDWRADLSAGLSSEGCTIKGNIRSSGERIYHLPFQDHYDRTRVSEDRGERWFCTEDEAIRAGWRRALR